MANERSQQTESTPTRTYHFDGGTLEIPKGLLDRTMHILPIQDEGPCEFNLVISQAKANGEDTLDDFADQLLAEMKRALPKFKLALRKACEIDASPAIELVYSWSNNGVHMMQRQVVTLVRDAQQEDVPQALMFAGTCLNTFTDAWNQAFDAAIASAKLRRPLQAPAATPVLVTQIQPIEQASRRYCFALCKQDQVLHVYASAAHAEMYVDPVAVKRGTWWFYDNNGQPLEAVFVSVQGVEGDTHPPAFTLQGLNGPGAFGPLQHRLATIERVVGLNGLDSLEALHQHLRAVSAGRPSPFAAKALHA